jgi:hypothetical protein
MSGHPGRRTPAANSAVENVQTSEAYPEQAISCLSITPKVFFLPKIVTSCIILINISGQHPCLYPIIKWVGLCGGLSFPMQVIKFGHEMVIMCKI